MVTITDLSSAFNSIKIASDLLKGVISLRDAQIFSGKLGEVNGHLLAAQASMFEVNQERATLIERIGALEKEIADIKDWNTEKQRYYLKEVATGSFAYALKESVEGIEPHHHICAKCYQDGRKSILQTRHEKVGRLGFLACHTCRSEIAA